MKKILILVVIILPVACYSQTFYVSGKDDKSCEVVEEKIKYEGYQITKDSAAADYCVQLMMGGQYKVVTFKQTHHGYIRIVNNISGSEIGRTKEAKSSPGVTNGYNASYSIFKKISKKYLSEMLKKTSRIYASKDS